MERYTGSVAGEPTHHPGTVNAAINQAAQTVFVNVGLSLLVRSRFVLNRAL